MAMIVNAFIKKYSASFFFKKTDATISKPETTNIIINDANNI